MHALLAGGPGEIPRSFSVRERSSHVLAGARLLAALVATGAAAGCSGPEADLGAEPEVDAEALTSSTLSLCPQNGAFGFSADGRYALVERCPASARRIVRIDLTTGVQKLVLELGTDEIVGGFHDEGGAFSASVFSRGSGPSSDVVSDWSAAHVVFTRGKTQFTASGGSLFFDWQGDLGGFALGSVASAAAPTFIATGIAEPTWHRSSRWLLLVSRNDPGQMRRFDLQTRSLGSLVTKPTGDPFGFGFAFDGARVYTVEPDLESQLLATDAATGTQTTLSSVGGRIGTQTVFAREDSPYVLYFASDTPGAPKVARTVKKDGTGATTYPSLVETRFVTIGVIGDRLSYSELLGAGRHLLLDPKSGSITPLPSDAERIADNFWSPSDRRLTSGATDAVLFAATTPATPSTSLHVAGDGRTVWEIRRNTCVEPGDLEVVVHKASGDTSLGCRPLRADRIVRVGKTAAIALVASAAVKILRP